jgi:hypothetical protein
MTASPHTPSKDDVHILHALYNEQASLQAIIDDPDTKENAFEKAIHDLEAITATIDARIAVFLALSVNPNIDSAKT